MRTTIKVLAIVALLLAVFGQNITASAAEIFKSKGLGAEAYFTSVDPSGCIVTDVGVFTRDENFQNPPGPGDPSSWVFLYISQYDYCTNTQLLYADGFTSLAEADFQTTKKLDWATLNTTVNVYNYNSDESFDVYVDLTWTGSGSLTRQNSHFHSHSPGCNINSHFKGTFRFAEASGTVSDGTTNFASEGSDFAQIFSARSGDVFVGCN